MYATGFSHVRLLAILWTVTGQAPLSMGFSRQEYFSGFPCPPPGDLPNPGIEPVSPVLRADSLPLSHQGSLVLNPKCNKKTLKYFSVDGTGSNLHFKIVTLVKVLRMD